MIVGVLLTVLVFVAVPLKYLPADGTSLQVTGDHLTTFVGIAHGWIYMVYLVVVLRALAAAEVDACRSPLLVLLAGLVPILIFWVEHKVTQRVRAEHPELVVSTSSTSVELSMSRAHRLRARRWWPARCGRGGHAPRPLRVRRAAGPDRRHLGRRAQRARGGQRPDTRASSTGCSTCGARCRRATTSTATPPGARSPGPCAPAPTSTPPSRCASGSTQEFGDLTFEQLAVPFQCCAASIERAAETWFSEGPVVPAVVASAAVPGLLPPAKVGDGALPRRRHRELDPRRARGRARCHARSSCSRSAASTGR